MSLILKAIISIFFQKVFSLVVFFRGGLGIRRKFKLELQVLADIKKSLDV